MSSISGFIIGGSGPVNGILTITGNNAIAVPGDGARNIDIVGSNLIDIEGNAGTNTLEVSVVGGDDAQVIMGRGGTGDLPIFATIVSGDGTVTATRDGNTLDLRANAGAIDVSALGADAGPNATPIGGVIDILGGDNINTVGQDPATNAVSVYLNEYIEWQATSSTTTGNIRLGGETFMHAYGFNGDMSDNNTFLGSESGNFTLLNGAANNTGIGRQALTGLTSGDSNTVVGAGSAPLMTTGSDNVIVGTESLTSAVGAQSNSVLGYQAGQNLVSGDFNILLGKFSGDSLTGSDGSNVIISSFGVVGDNNTIRIGTQGVGDGQQNAAFMAGIHNTAYGPSGRVVQIGSDGKLGSSTGGVGTVLIGGGSQPEWRTITEGTGISVTNGANSIEIAVDGAATEFITDVPGPVSPNGSGQLTVTGVGVVETEGLVANTVGIGLKPTTQGDIIIGTGLLTDPVYGQITSPDNSIGIDTTTSGEIRLTSSAISRMGAFKGYVASNIPSATGNDFEWVFGNTIGAFTEVYDYASAFNPGNGAGTPTSFTAPIDGIYAFKQCVTLGLNDVNTGRSMQSIQSTQVVRVNGTPVHRILLSGADSQQSSAYFNSTNGQWSFPWAYDLNLSSGDVVTWGVASRNNRQSSANPLPTPDLSVMASTTFSLNPPFLTKVTVNSTTVDGTYISGYLVTPL